MKLPVLNSVEENGSERIKMPFEDWLFIKLYCKQTREEELIAFEIADIYNQISDQYPVRHFFMRYRDPKPHIRLRLNGKAEVLYSLFPQLLNWLKSLREKGLVTEFVITQYEREIERYGGLDLMDAAEQVFCEDSKVVETMIRMHRMKDIAISKEIAGMVSVIQFLEQFELTFEEQLTFLEKIACRMSIVLNLRRIEKCILKYATLIENGIISEKQVMAEYYMKY